MYLQINTVNYDTVWEIMNLWKVWSQICADRLLFIYIWSTSNIYCFISIQIRCQRILTNSHSVTFGNSQYLVQYLLNDTEGKKTTIHHYLVCWSFSFSQLKFKNSKIFFLSFLCYKILIWTWTSKSAFDRAQGYKTFCACNLHIFVIS